MYELIRSLGSREALVHQLPVATLSILIAEIFYKFHSFTLEALAFLGTWYSIDALRARFLS